MNKKRNVKATRLSRLLSEARNLSEIGSTSPYPIDPRELDVDPRVNRAQSHLNPLGQYRAANPKRAPQLFKQVAKAAEEYATALAHTNGQVAAHLYNQLKALERDIRTAGFEPSQVAPETMGIKAKMDADAREAAAYVQQFKKYEKGEELRLGQSPVIVHKP